MNYVSGWFIQRLLVSIYYSWILKFKFNTIEKLLDKSHRDKAWKIYLTDNTKTSKDDSDKIKEVPDVSTTDLTSNKENSLNKQVPSNELESKLLEKNAYDTKIETVSELLKVEHSPLTNKSSQAELGTKCISIDCFKK